MPSNNDAIIIGSGHNGLVCGSYLAKAGLRTLLLERRHLVGGAAVTEEFSPGFRASRISYVMSLLHPRVIRDLELRESGLEIARQRFCFALWFTNAVRQAARVVVSPASQGTMPRVKF